MRANSAVWSLAGVIMIAASVSGAQPDACGILSPEAIRRATGEQATNTKATSHMVRKVRQSQCFYTLPTFTNSISVTLTEPAREMWERWFHGDGGDADSEEEEAAAKATPVAGVGDEAFWVHSFVGNLYVRKGNRSLRISLGGKITDEERQTRAKILAAEALRRLR